MLYPINEYFMSFQGEGSFAGTPCLFIRTQGCNVNCPWCDTKHTWSTKGQQGSIIDKTADSPIFEMMATADLVALAKDCRHVVITGGEPCLHNLMELTESLINVGKTVQIETTGTSEILAHSECFITISPKFHSKLQVLRHTRCDELKFPIQNWGDIEKVHKFLEEHDYLKVPVYLQPISLDSIATQICYDAALKNGWRMSLQIHKFIGFR